MNKNFLTLPEDWKKKLNPLLPIDYFNQMQDDIQSQLDLGKVIYPEKKDMLNAFTFTPYNEVKVVWLGQDPYHNKGEATGLCFAVNENIKLPPSLRNLFKELKSDLNQDPPNADLKTWANQGILLLNATLSVIENDPQSHKNLGWSYLLEATIQALISDNRPLVFVLLGKSAEDILKPFEKDLQSFHKLIIAKHPSPLSAHRGFFGSKIFSQINLALKEFNLKEIKFGL